MHVCEQTSNTSLHCLFTFCKHRQRPIGNVESALVFGIILFTYLSAEQNGGICNFIIK